MAPDDRVILPTDVRPVRYTLTLEPDLTEFTFRGEQTVNVEVVESTSSISMNAAELDIQSCRLIRDGGEFEPSATSFDEERETVTFEFAEALAPGPASLRISFTGELNDKLRGFYRSHYTDEHGQERNLATTQFEATDARRAFPCWDEPARKATFEVTLLVPPELVAISNMPVASESQAADGRKRVEFTETPVMSTYLLAFVVGDLKAVEETADDGTLVRVWAPAGKEINGGFALDVSVRLLSYFNDYFGIPYPLAKLDHIAIPDFAAGAMENWGAVTYRETALLIDPEHSSAAARQRVASVISHEMAHMWFGDLVTMAWWNDLWLNESFASWMGDRAVDHLFPEWDVWTQFVSEDTNRGLSLDGLKSSHPIEQSVRNPAEIGQLFDAISYSKGGSILRMLERYLGADVFREGLRRYLARHQYGNARTTDLWDALGEVSGRPVAAMMDTWVNQMGYPVLEVRTDPGDGGILVSATQTRFVYENLIDRDGAGDALWHIPLGVRTDSGVHSAPELMEGARATLPIESAGGWVKVNPDQTGFYRVNYSSEDWARLGPAVRGKLVPAVDRLGVQSDAYALAKAGYLPVTEFLALAEAYVDETDATVWSDLAGNLGGLDLLLAVEPYHPGFEALGRRLFSGVAARMGWEPRAGEGHLDTLLRTTALTELGGYGDEATLGEGARRFAGYVADRARVPADLRGVVFGLAAKGGDESVYNTIWDLQKRASLEEEKSRLLRALTQFERPELLSDLLRRSLTDDVRTHETIRVISGVAANSRGRDMAWEFVKDSWDELNRRYGEGGFALMELVSITSRFSTQERLDEVRGFFEAHPVAAAERSIRQSLERIGLNVAWLDQNRAALAEWLGGRG